MSTPILATKLYVPPSRSSLVARPHLIDRLNSGLDGKLTLIAAPAGFGKTTLVGAWLAARQQPVAWYSLDEGDGDPIRFLSYLIAAFQTVSPSVGEEVLVRLQSPQVLPIESLLTVLLNEVATVPDNLILVLDDYHVLDAQPIDHAVTFLLDHLPPQMHVVITTREDPQLPLARYRVRSQLTEIRATDLRFTPAEAAKFFKEVMGLDLSAEEIVDLETRTEGWIAGLQMAALAMQGLAMQGPSIEGHADTGSFIQAFTGSHRFVLDYLVEDVLQNQPKRVRRFLLQTAILSRLSGPLCEAVTASEDGRGMLERLERSNLFVVPLDDERHWYRYHHLFADALRTRLIDEQSHQVPVLHRRASQWCEQNGLLVDAIQHALAAEDLERAADLIELARPSLEKGTRDKTLRGWVEHLPYRMVRARPALNLGYAWALLDAGDLEAAKRRLQDVERSLAADDGANTVVTDEAQYRAIPASLATAWVYYAQAKGDILGTIKYAEQALLALPEDAYTWRAQIMALLGLTYWATGDLDKAQRALQDAATFVQHAGNALDTIPGAFVVADILVTRGRLHEARRTYEDALHLAVEHGEPALLGLEHVYSGLSDLHREWNDLTAAAQDLASSKRLGERVGERVWRYRWRLAQARLNESLGNLDGALDMLNEAAAGYIRTPLPDVRPIAAMKTRVWLKQGKLSPALSWVRARGLLVDDDLSYAREFEHITLARVLIAQYRRERIQNHSIHQVEKLLLRLLKAAQSGGRVGSAIEILMLQALAHEAQQDIPAALTALECALTLAEPAGYVRTFVDEGSAMEQLLRRATDRGLMPAYTGKLLAAFGPEEKKTIEAPSPPVVSSPQPLIEPLSQRELDVLRLLNSELSGPEIADELVVALSTVRTHTKRIYGKLDVNSRRAAVKRAAELGLI